MQDLISINRRAPLETVHPNALDWPTEISKEELEFYSYFSHRALGFEEEAKLHIAKELIQLSEIEKHVSVVMGIIMAEMQGEQKELVRGFALHNALSCFAAEEYHHADMFYRYVRVLLQEDIILVDNRMKERVALYQGDDSPLVKLAALVASAYVGETVITLFEKRLNMMDPMKDTFLSQMIWAHGLDEARHIQFDHFVFQEVIPNLTQEERARFIQILTKQNEINHSLGVMLDQQLMSKFGIDYIKNSPAREIQEGITVYLVSRLFQHASIETSGKIPLADEVLDDERLALIKEFANIEHIHPRERKRPHGE